MDIRYAANPKDAKKYTTEELRKEFLVQNLYQPDEVVAVYSHVDRMVVLGIMPVHETVPVDKGINVWGSFGTSYFLERREAGFFNIGAPGSIKVDGVEYKMGNKDCIYITRGVKDIVFASDNPEAPAQFYGISSPAHCSYETKFISIADAAKRHVGDAKTSNERTINQFIHPDVVTTCQLQMGLTQLAEGSVWNTMPVHTHERRMEIYTYFDIPEDNVVFHFMGEPQETRHLVMKNAEAVIGPSWSIHSGCGTSNYTFIWAMGGENQAYDDMDTIATTELL